MRAEQAGLLLRGLEPPLVEEEVCTGGEGVEVEGEGAGREGEKGARNGTGYVKREVFEAGVEDGAPREVDGEEDVLEEHGPLLACLHEEDLQVGVHDGERDARKARTAPQVGEGGGEERAEVREGSEGVQQVDHEGLGRRVGDQIDARAPLGEEVEVGEEGGALGGGGREAEEGEPAVEEGGGILHHWAFLDRERYTMRTAMSELRIPEMREACPRERGRIVESFSLASEERPSTSE